MTPAERAIAAVLALHARDEYGNCSVCTDPFYMLGIDYPCDTVQTIHTELGTQP